MSLSMYELAVVPLRKGVADLGGVLSKAAAYCDEKQIDPSVLLATRLFPNMFPLVRQFQLACDQACSAAAYLAGTHPEPAAGDEVDFMQLQARVETSLAFLDRIEAGQLEGSEGRPVEFAIGTYKMAFPSGQVYLQKFALPNFYFHVTTAYNILRHCAVDLGKGDYLGDYGAQVTMA